MSWALELGLQVSGVHALTTARVDPSLEPGQKSGEKMPSGISHRFLEHPIL